MNLNAIDTDDLKIISTILQDGLIEVNDIKYLPSIRSFFLMITRFMWEEKIVNKVDQRIRAVLSFEDVLSVYSKNTARIADKFCDLVLVGDSLGSVLYNYKSTKEVTLDTMIEHSKSVRQGVKKSLMVVDICLLYTSPSPRD